MSGREMKCQSQPASVSGCRSWGSSVATMTTPVGRGRGYASRNRDLRRPGNLIIPNDNHGLVGTSLKTSPNMTSVNVQSPPTNASEQMFSNPSSLVKIAKATSPPTKHLNLSQTVPTMNKQSAGSVPPYYQNYRCDDDDNVDENTQSVLQIDEKYSYLIQQVNVLSSSDDGILTNQKLKHIEGVLAKECPQPKSLRNAMEAIASAAILDTKITAKVSKMMCSVLFSRVQIHQLRLHSIFVSALRDKVDGLELTLDGADQYLLNASTLLTEIFTDSKLLEKEELKVLANLIIQVFIDLLECNTPLSLRTLNVQLMQYGRALHNTVPEELDSISLSARKLMISRHPPPFACRIWLALLSDQCLYQFQPLPKYLQDFYAKHLDESNQENEPKRCRYTGKPLSRDDLPAKKLPKASANHRTYDNNQSVSKEYRKTVKSDSSDKSTNRHHQDQVKDDVFDDKLNYDDSANVDYYSDVSNDHGVSVQNFHEKKPRPILGAGARIAQQPKSDSDNQFMEPPPMMSYNQAYSSESAVEIPKFCPSVPPPNFIPRNSDIKGSEKVLTSVSQDTGDFWNYPPPKLEPVTHSVSSLSSRLDLNSWRQQANMEDTSKDPIDDKSGILMQNFYEQNSEDFDGNQLRINLDDSLGSLDKLNIQENLDDDVENKAFNDTGVSFWGKKRNEDSDSDKNWSRNGGRQSSERKGFDVKKDANWIKKEAEEKDSNWRRRGSDEKNWDGKKANNWSGKKPADVVAPDPVEDRSNRSRTDSVARSEEDGDFGDKKSSGRRDSRGSGRGTKRDFMEVPRKASYWTHDDRCDKDYDD